MIPETQLVKVEKKFVKPIVNSSKTRFLDPDFIMHKGYSKAELTLEELLEQVMDFILNEALPSLPDAIQKQLTSLNVRIDQRTLLQYVVSEAVKNALDAFAEHLKQYKAEGKQFELKVVLGVNKQGQLALKIKDNGPGLSKYSPSQVIDISEIESTKRSHSYRGFGGLGIGLNNSALHLGRLDYLINVKNRKESVGGATVNIILGQVTDPVEELTRKAEKLRL